MIGTANSAMVPRETAGSGDLLSWEDLVEELVPRLYHYFWYRIGDSSAAEDLVGETFERAWKGRRGYRRAKGGEKEWVFGIARHVIADHHRRAKRSGGAALAPDPGTSPEEAIQQAQDGERLQEMLWALGKRDQEIIALKYGAGLTNRGIGRLTGLGESNVGTILHRVVARLRERWEGSPS